jgi:hypothetical protein
VRPDRRTLGLRNLDAFRQTVGHHFTNPPESALVIDDYLHLTMPGTVTLSRKGNHLAQVNKDGYEPACSGSTGPGPGGSSEILLALDRRTTEPLPLK